MGSYHRVSNGNGNGNGHRHHTGQLGILQFLVIEKSVMK